MTSHLHAQPPPQEHTWAVRRQGLHVGGNIDIWYFYIIKNLSCVTQVPLGKVKVLFLDFVCFLQLSGIWDLGMVGSGTIGRKKEIWNRFVHQGNVGVPVTLEAGSRGGAGSDPWGPGRLRVLSCDVALSRLSLSPTQERAALRTIWVDLALAESQRVTQNTVMGSVITLWATLAGPRRESKQGKVNKRQISICLLCVLIIGWLWSICIWFHWPSDRELEYPLTPCNYH